MKTSKLTRRNAKELFRSCLIGGLPEEDRVRKAVNMLVHKKPRGYLAILHHFQRLLRFDIQRRTAQVESAVPLPDSQRQKIEHALARKYDEGLQTHFNVNPGILGGLRIQVGSDVYDGSIAARLQRIENDFY